MRDRQTPAARTTKAGGGAETRRVAPGLHRATPQEKMKSSPTPPHTPTPSRAELVSQKHKPEQIKSMQSPVSHLSTSAKIFHTFATKKEKEEKREGGRKFTAIITLHQLTQISLFFSIFFTFQVKGCTSFILQRHANLSVSPSPSFQ